MNITNHSRQRKRFRRIVLLLWLTAPAAAADGIDCATPRSGVERHICSPENAELREADRTLATLYSRMRDELPPERARWLQESHRNWLNARDRLGAGPVYSLLPHYRKRIDELRRGDIVNSISRAELPYRVVLPGGTAGEFVLEEARSERTGKRTRTDIRQRLLFRGAAGEQTLWEGEGELSSDDEPSGQFRLFKGLSLISMQGARLFAELEENAYGSGMSIQLIGLTATGEFVRQGRIEHNRSTPRFGISPRVCNTGGGK